LSHYSRTKLRWMWVFTKHMNEKSVKHFSAERKKCRKCENNGRDVKFHELWKRYICAGQVGICTCLLTYLNANRIDPNRLYIIMYLIDFVIQIQGSILWTQMAALESIWSGIVANFRNCKFKVCTVHVSNS
jgi:hypothetical protein